MKDRHKGRDLLINVSTETATSKSQTTIAFERLRSDILIGHLRPDVRLRIQGLSERYQLGTTAIREALSRLVTDGLVAAEEQRGFCVAPVSRDDLIDLTQTRSDLEGLAVTKAVQSGDLEWESSIMSAYHRLSKTPPPSTPELHAAWTQVHRQFHESLIHGCKSPWLRRLCNELYDKSERYRNLAEQPRLSGHRDTIKEHRELMDAAIGRDAETLKHLLGAHFWMTTNIILASGFVVE